MKSIFIILFFLFAWSGIQAQAIVKGTGVLYTNGAPTNPVNISVDAEICIDTASGLWYEYNRDAGSWAKAGFRVQRKNISIAPTGAPGDKQSEIAINDVDSIYLWRSGAWRHLNKVGDPSITNEGSLTVGAGTGTTSIINSNTSGSTGVTVTAGTGLGISESGNTITLTNSSPDQTVALTGAGITAVTGTYPNFTITSTEVDGSVSNEGALTVGAGSGTTSIINSNTSGSTGVTVTAGTGLGISESGNTITLTNSSPDQTVSLTGAGITAVTGTYPNFTITSTEVDGSVTNELQTVNNTSDATSHTVTLSNTGGSVQLVEGANVTLTTTGTGSDGIVTVAVPSTILPTVAATDILIGTGSPGYQSAGFAQFTSAGMDVSGGKPYNLLNTSTGVRNSWQFSNDSTTYFSSSLGGSPFGHYVRGKNLLYYRQYSFFGGNENNVSSFNSEINGVNVITPGSTLTGVVNGAVSEATRKITLINESASNSLIISNQNTASIAANRFSIGSDYTLAAGKMISFVYDKSISRWVFYKPQGDIAPDQVVSLTGAGITAVTGTYPNFTITSTEVDGSVSNEGSLTVGAGSGTTSIINSNTSGSTGVTLTAGTGLDISESGNVITLSSSLTGLPSGTDGQTLRNSSGTWISNSFLLNTGSNIGIGRTPGKVLDVQGQIRAIGSGSLFSNSTSPTLLLENSSSPNGKQWYMHSDNSGYFNISESALGGSGINFWRIEPVNGNASFGDAGFVKKVNIEGTARLLDLTGDTPTRGVGADADGDLCEIIFGTGLTLSGDTLKATGGGGGDPSITNEGILGVGAGSGTSSTLVSNTSTANAVTINAAGILAITESTSSNGGSITLTATEVDGSTTNELQTVNNTSDATSHTVTLSNTGGSIQLVEGANVTLTTTGTASDAIVTIAATGGGGGSPVVITPASITATQNDYSPTGWSTATVVFLSNDGVDIWGITGFSSSGLSSGHTKRLVNTSKTQIYITPNHPSSSSANRVTGSRDFILGYGKSVDIVFNGSTWFLLGESASPTVYLRWNPGSVTTGDWGDVAFAALNSGTITNISGPDATSPYSNLATTAASTTGGGVISMSKTNTKIARINTGHLFMESSLKTPSSLSNATDSYTCGVGFGAITASSSLTANNCIAIRYNHSLNAGNWTLTTVNSAGTTTDVDLGVAVAADTRYNLRIEVSDDGLEVRAFVNGEMKGISTTNMPANTAEFLAKTQILKSAGTADRQLGIMSLETGLHLKY